MSKLARAHLPVINGRRLVFHNTINGSEAENHARQLVSIDFFTLLTIRFPRRAPEKCDHPLCSFGSMTLNLVPKCAHVRRRPQARSRIASNTENRVKIFVERTFVPDRMAFPLGQTC